VTLRALLLDVDGTLADTERYGHRPAYNRAFRKLGLKFHWTPSLYRQLLEAPGGKERLLLYVEQYHPDLGDHAAAVRADPQAWARSVHELKSHYFRRSLRRGRVPLRPGVARLIREARSANVRVALVSNASRASLQPILDFGLGSELAGEIETIVSGEDVQNKKPSPDGYLLALQRLGLHAEECVALEDSAMGLSAAAAAHIPTVVTVNANTDEDDFSQALMVLDHLGEPDSPAHAVRGTLEGPCLTVSAIDRILQARVA
jgi:HAD superfamily hydrolase (TIGR01509 family)